MSSLVSIGAGVVILVGALSVLCGIALPRELLVGALMAVGTPLIVGNRAAGRALGALGACWLASRMWLHAGEAADPRVMMLLYLLCALMLATAAGFISRTGN